jgi:hypothetical protein
MLRSVTTDLGRPAPIPGRTDGDHVLDVLPWNEDAIVRSVASRQLPAELLRAGAVRLSGIALGATVVLSIQLGVALALHDGEAARRVGPASIAAIVASLAVFGMGRFRRLGADLKLDIGFAYLVLLALLLGLMRHAWPSPAAGPVSWSPVAIPLVVFGALIPYRPNSLLLVLLAAASMDPFAAYLTGATADAPAHALASCLSPYLGAFIGFGLSRVTFGLSERAATASEIGSYRLVERLGAGRMAEVWKATHKMLARPAAVKLMRGDVLAAHGPAEAQRLVRLFAREARTTAALTSPHTIRVYDFGITRDGAFYFVTELLDGLDLKALVERFGPQPGERVCHLVRQVCHSLREAHARSFVHRDIKPANVFTCRAGEDVDFAKVLDFGLVLDRHPTAEELEDEQRFVGTPAVMAPEMVRFQAPVDARADIYAVGCVAYWLLTARHVFEAQSRQDMLVMHAHQKPVVPSKRLGSPVHPALETLVMACLDKNPNHRPQTAAELEEALAAISFEHLWTPERARLWWQRNLTDRT